jgi:hypothetical protein
MQKDERDLLEVLEFELVFLEKGGYGRSTREPWRFQFIFEDSPTCMNYDSKNNPAPCGECVLMGLVPPEQRKQTIPCRHIPLNAAGETLDTLYRFAEQHELESIYGKWLRETIARLKADRSNLRAGLNPASAPAGTLPVGEPLFGKLHPKCANPACAAAFHWLAGGRFFRFRPGSLAASTRDDVAQDSEATAVAKHYWLCERCAQVYTLNYDEIRGVLIEPQWPELPESEPAKEFPAVRQ